MTSRSLASDNASGIHPDVLRAIAEANEGHVLAYGEDPYTEAAIAAIREAFGPEAQVLFTFGGTGANVVSLASVMRPFEAVLCAESSHLWLDECAAPERFIGGKLLPVPAVDGKLTPDAVAAKLARDKGVHQAQPRVLSITQATEWGTVYQPDEIRALADLAHERGMVLHVDGARLANAAAFLETSLAAITTDVGVDVLSFGGTKNGLLGGEAVVFLDPELGRAAPFVRKQAAQLASKMRFIAAQFQALLSNELWRRNAAHANTMARRLAEGVSAETALHIVCPVQTNAVFPQIPPEHVAALQARCSFHLWDAERSIARWMTSFDTTKEDVDSFAAAVREVLSGARTGG